MGEQNRMRLGTVAGCLSDEQAQAQTVLRRAEGAKNCLKLGVQKLIADFHEEFPSLYVQSIYTEARREDTRAVATVAVQIGLCD